MDFDFDQTDTTWFDQVLTDAANKWAESEESRAEHFGELRAVGELAFRDKLLSEKSEKSGKSEKFFWVTVNPKPGILLPVLKASVEKMVSKKWIERYAYVYEISESGHEHAHALIKGPCEPARARKELSSSCNKICNTTIPACFKFVVIDEALAREKLDYMLGKKKKKKLKGVELTKTWREDNNLQEIYCNEGLPILLDPRESDSGSPHTDIG